MTLQLYQRLVRIFQVQCFQSKKSKQPKLHINGHAFLFYKTHNSILVGLKLFRTNKVTQFQL